MTASPEAVRNLGLSLTGGLLAALAFPNPFAIALDWPGGFLAFFALVPLLMVAEPQTGWPTLRWGAIFGLVYFGVALVWVAGMASLGPWAPLCWLLLSAYLACYPAVFLWGLSALRRAGVPVWSAAPLLWVTLEYLRNYALTGFPWVALGFAQHQNPWMLVLAPVTGLWGLSWVTALINAGLYTVGLRWAPAWFRSTGAPVPSASARWLTWVRSALLLVLLFGLGARTWHEHARIRAVDQGEPVKIGILQGSVDQNQPWDPRFQRNTFAVFNRLGSQAVQQGARLLLWPETAFPGVMNQDPNLLQEVAGWSKQWQAAQVIGSDLVQADPQGRWDYLNALVLMDATGVTLAATAKVHLVPFGEYVPWKDGLLAWVDQVVRRYGGAGFTPGKGRVLLPWNLDGQQVPLGALICFESVFPQYALELARKGAQLLVISTYDTWFGRTAAPAQHALAAALDAAATGRYTLRVAASGISAAFDPFGHRLAVLPLNGSGQLTLAVRPLTLLTLASRWGDWFAWLCLLFLALESLTLLPVHHRKRP